MNPANLWDRFFVVLQTSDSIARQALAREIIDDKLELRSLLPILLGDVKIATRFSWVLGDLTQLEPSNASIILPFCIQEMKEIKIKNFDRTIAKQFMLSATILPESLEHQMLQLLIPWFSDHSKSIMTRKYSIKALHQLSNKYPDLKIELYSILIDLPLEENSLNHLVRKIEKQLKKELSALNINLHA